MEAAAPALITPRIIIHGGAGSITRANLSPALYAAHRAALLDIVRSTAALLEDPATTALEGATHAAARLELNPLFNAGRGAVFTTAGRVEHEASVMLSTAHPVVPAGHALAASSSTASSTSSSSAAPAVAPAVATAPGTVAYARAQHADLESALSGPDDGEHSGGTPTATANLVKVACATMRTSRVKHPVLLAGMMLAKGTEANGGGAQGHVQLCGEAAERLAVEWGLEMVRPSWHWERKRWEQHRRGRGLGTGEEEYRAERAAADREAGFSEEEEEEAEDGGNGQGESALEDEGLGGADGIERLRRGSRDATEDCAYAEATPNDQEKAADSAWNGRDYLPQGTIGAVVLDRYGTICVATSTGGMTNKLPGRIGDTPTIGAGFWAESWRGDGRVLLGGESSPAANRVASPLQKILEGDWLDVLKDWLPQWMLPDLPPATRSKAGPRALGMSGTGNGDSFLKVCCARTVGAMVRFSSPVATLQAAVTKMAGVGGLLQESAEDRWGKTGEGEGGIIGIELVNGVGEIVSDFNCGGMFRAWRDAAGQDRMMVFKEDYSR